MQTVAGINQVKSVKVTTVQEMGAVDSIQNQLLVAGITNQLCGAERISAGMVFMPPGKVSRPHMHPDSEIIVICVQGWAATLIGPDLEPKFHGPGEFIFVPEGVVHVAVNLSLDQHLVAIEARSDRHFNEDTVLLPELDEKTAAAVADLRRRVAAGDLDLPATWSESDRDKYVLSGSHSGVFVP